jgi:hypothetical protein
MEVPPWLLVGTEDLPTDDWLLPSFEPRELPDLPKSPEPLEEQDADEGDKVEMKLSGKEIGKLAGSLPGSGLVDAFTTQRVLGTQLSSLGLPEPIRIEPRQLDIAQPTLDVPNFDLNEFKIEAQTIRGEANAIRHKDAWVSDFFYLLITPDAPRGEHEITVQFISEEFSDYREARLKVRVSDTDG